MTSELDFSRRRDYCSEKGIRMPLGECLWGNIRMPLGLGEYKYLKGPFPGVKEASLCILSNSTFEGIATMFPDVQILSLAICGSTFGKPVRDASLLLSMPLTELYIGSSFWINDTPPPFVKNLNSLKELNLKKLNLGNHVLDPENPRYEWETLNPKYEHIKSIHSYGPSLIIYNVSSREYKNLIDSEDGDAEGENIIVQKLKLREGDRYLVFHHYLEGNHADEILLRELTLREFNRLIHGSSSNKKLPDLTAADLRMKIF